jgi:hypothetical protein
MSIIQFKYFHLDVGYPVRYRRFRFLHNRRASSVYIQILWVEIGVWYR